MDFLIDDAALQVAVSESGGRRLVVSFAGVGFGHAYEQKAEFGRTLGEGASPANDVCYVMDKQRSWYNLTAPRIHDWLERYSAGREVCTLGNSMGGFGALLFGRRLPGCRAAIAFAPQFSVRPSIVPGEKRWRTFIDRIADWAVDTCVPPAANGAASFLFFGADDRSDWRHADLFRAALDGNAAIFTIARCRHDVAAFLREKGVLTPLVDAIVNGDAEAEEVAALLKAYGVSHRLWRSGDAVAPGWIEKAQRQLAAIAH